jgi:hypothetical protein
LPSKDGADGTEGYGVMAGRLRIVNCVEEFWNQFMPAMHAMQTMLGKWLTQIGSNAQCLSTHLPAGIAQFTCRLHGIELVIDDNAPFYSKRLGKCRLPRCDRGNNVSGRDRALQIGKQEGLDPIRIVNGSRCGVGFETEGMGI